MATAIEDVHVVGFYLPELDRNGHVYQIWPGPKFDSGDFNQLMEKVGSPCVGGSVGHGLGFDPLFFVAALQDKLFEGVDTLTLMEKKIIREKINALVKVNAYMENTCANIRRIDYAKYKASRNKATQPVQTINITGSVTGSPVWQTTATSPGISGYQNLTSGNGSYGVTGIPD